MGGGPGVGFKPQMPLKCAGTRMDPAPSVPRPAAEPPAAIAAASPPLDPPGGHSSHLHATLRWGGDAVESAESLAAGAGLFGSVGLLEGASGVKVGKGVQLRVQAFDAIEIGPHDLNRGDFLFADVVRQFGKKNRHTESAVFTG